MKKIKETRVIVYYGLSYINLVLLIENFTEFSYDRGILIPYIQKILVLVTLNPYQTKLKKQLNHGKKFESRLFWLAASPDGVVAYQISDKNLILEIKCPHTMRHMSPIETIVLVITHKFS